MVNSLPRSFRQEIATVKNDITYPLYGGFISGDNSRLRWKDKVLEQKGGAETYEIYQDLKRDPHVYAVLQKRYMAVISREWYVDAGGDRRIDQKAADLVQAQLAALSARIMTEHQNQTVVSGAGGFDATCLGLLDAILIGFSASEIIWGKDDKEIYPQEIRVKDQQRFAFFADAKANSFGIRLLTPNRQYVGEPLPNKKFIVHTFHGERDNPYGMGLGGKLYWPVFFKKNDVKFWLAFCDKYGSPTAIGKYQQGNKGQRDELLKAIRAIAQEAGIAIPEGTSLEFLEANRNGAITAYKDLADYMDQEISKAVLGETGTTNQSDGGGSRARDEVANGIRLEIAKFDADLLSDTLNRTLIKWIVDYNFAPGTVAYPKLWRRFPELEEKEDLNGRINRDKGLQELGWRLTAPKVEEIYGTGYESAVDEDAGQEPPLVSTLGVGGVQALTGFLSQVSDGSLPRENAIATLTVIFGISPENAEKMIPEQSEEGEGSDIQGELDSIFGGESTEADAGVDEEEQPGAEQDDAQAEIDSVFSATDEEPEKEATELAESKESPQDIAKLYTEQSMEAIQPAIASWIAQVDGLIDEVSDLELSDEDKFLLLQERLVELYPEMSGDDYASVLGEAIAAADIAGRYEVIEELPVEDIEFNEWFADFSKARDRNKKTCNPQKSFPCGNSCQPHKTRTGKPTQCRKRLEGQAKTAQEWLKQNTQSSASEKVELFQEHIVSSDKHINLSTIDAAWDVIQTEGAEERKALVRQIINEQRIQAVFNDSKSTQRNKIESLYRNLEYKTFIEDEITGAILNEKTLLRMNGLSEAEIDKALSSSSIEKISRTVMRQHVGSIGKRVRGYTRQQDRHVTVATDSSNKTRKTRGFQVLPEFMNDAVDDVFSNPLEDWGVTSNSAVSAEAEFKTYLHEIGHQIHYSAQDGGARGIPPSGVKKFTQYSTTNNEEYFAEHFTLWVLNAERFREVDPIGHEYVESVVTFVQGRPRRIS